MTTQEIKTGLKFKEERDSRIFTVTKVTAHNVFYNTETYACGWRYGLDRFLRKFNNFGASVIQD